MQAGVAGKRCQWTMYQSITVIISNLQLWEKSFGVDYVAVRLTMYMLDNETTWRCLTNPNIVDIVI